MQHPDVKKETAKDLYDIAWPKCAQSCALVEMLGVCECESACPHKFPEEQHVRRPTS